MPALIDYTYFRRYLNIPNSDLSNPANPQGRELEDAILLYESEFLSEILGYELYKDFLANPSLTIYQDLINGKEFTDKHGRLNTWLGFNNILRFTNISHYVYYYVQAHRASNTVGIGETITDAENGSRDSPSTKMIKAWNKMVDLNWVLDDFLRQNSSLYPTYIGLKYPPHNRFRSSGGCGCASIDTFHRLFIKIQVHNFGAF